MDIVKILFSLEALDYWLIIAFVSAGIAEVVTNHIDYLEYLWVGLQTRYVLILCLCTLSLMGLFVSGIWLVLRGKIIYLIIAAHMNRWVVKKLKGKIKVDPQIYDMYLKSKALEKIDAELENMLESR